MAKTGQLQGPFFKGENLMPLITKQIGNNNFTLFKIGIVVRPHQQYAVLINNNSILIGKNGILEYNNVDIFSLCFLQDVFSDTIIDYSYR